MWVFLYSIESVDFRRQHVWKYFQVSRCFWLIPAKHFFLEEPNISWDERVYDGGKCFWWKMFLVWCWCFPVNVNIKEQNFNIYVGREHQHQTVVFPSLITKKSCEMIPGIFVLGLKISEECNTICGVSRGQGLFCLEFSGVN